MVNCEVERKFIATIGRNGIRDCRSGRYYWSDSMISMRGKRVYVKQNNACPKTILIFDVKDGVCLGEAHLIEAVPAIVKPELEQLKMARKKISYKPCENCGCNYWQVTHRTENGTTRKVLFCNVCYMEVPAEEFKITTRDGSNEAVLENNRKERIRIRLRA